jgi:hypothetical protein
MNLEKLQIQKLFIFSNSVAPYFFNSWSFVTQLVDWIKVRSVWSFKWNFLPWAPPVSLPIPLLRAHRGSVLLPLTLALLPRHWAPLMPEPAPLSSPSPPVPTRAHRHRSLLSFPFLTWARPLPLQPLQWAPGDRPPCRSLSITEPPHGFALIPPCFPSPLHPPSRAEPVGIKLFPATIPCTTAARWAPLAGHLLLNQPMPHVDHPCVSL